MLLLTRKINESILIGDNIRVTIKGVNDKRVRIGVLAPDNMPVHREEVYSRLKREQERD
ncbi:MAG: carbon storage regulator [Gammaproteobacteria bacterium CG11_big_fil_rev_8_21_14_0_20_46_22]|nr:MAG: carbon storage regulator [Gammaproteobacteria bacterium CG12_big_fil_rev_8_21_14_0_65_46_12]PIR11768.1 MAG: carbon storage regulator [Gammaproteobacteria bacterium CG11_big_fil_rev_8_21_14_0_20_46_22]